MIEIIATPQFDKDIKYYKTKKKYKHVEDDVNSIVLEIEKGNFIGDEIPNLSLSNGKHTYKVRVANSDTNSGKSNGYRVIYYAIDERNVVYLLSIYYKKDEFRVLTNNEIINVINEYCD